MACNTSCRAGRRPPGTEHPPRSQRAPRGSWSSSRSLASVVLAVLHRRAVHEDARLERSSCMWRPALRETPGRHVLVVGHLASSLLRLRIFFGSGKPSDANRSTSRVSSSLSSGCRLPGCASSAGGSGSSSESSELATPWRPLREARSRLESSREALPARLPRGGIAPCGKRPTRLSRRDQPAFSLFNFTEGIFDTCLLLARLIGIPGVI